MEFSIQFRRHQDPIIYRATVAILYHTDNLLKLVVRAGGKEIFMDKLLYRKSNQWKIASTNFQFGNDNKRNAMMILEIQREIDKALEKKGRFI